jgi:hypothetical protein
MRGILNDRIAYGRRVRERALCLIEAHGPHAEALARDAADEFGLPEAERGFWSAVADRIVRLSAAGRAPDLECAMRQPSTEPRSRYRRVPPIVPHRHHAA